MDEHAAQSVLTCMEHSDNAEQKCRLQMALRGQRVKNPRRAKRSARNSEADLARIYSCRPSPMLEHMEYPVVSAHRD